MGMGELESFPPGELVPGTFKGAMTIAPIRGLNCICRLRAEG